MQERAPQRDSGDYYQSDEWWLARVGLLAQAVTEGSVAWCSRDGESLYRLTGKQPGERVLSGEVRPHPEWLVCATHTREHMRRRGVESAHSTWYIIDERARSVATMVMDEGMKVTQPKRVASTEELAEFDTILEELAQVLEIGNG